MEDSLTKCALHLCPNTTDLSVVGLWW
ncbi:hypothetical protein LSH36_735g00027 [Paralvinella palmiformis]|uniref:Uncharacterized protein n=1 Tax=Paralvinella palmiformis TaxID=53620 RepID=A0AAD9J242_9ANNE|nr:hypothetical protein LSH36_735g00027 [Paralvinella palmiformis]